MSSPRLVASRRTTLGGALAGLAIVAGCDDGPSMDELTSGATTSPPRAADTDLVDQVATHILSALGAVGATRSSSPKLRATLRPLERLHKAHLSALDSNGTRLKTNNPVGIAQVRAAETRLERQLTDAAVAAESGALAGLLASMAAAVAQHLAVLP